MQNASLVRRGKTIGEADDELDDVLPRPWTRVAPVSERAAVNELTDKVLAPLQLAGDASANSVETNLIATARLNFVSVAR
jgi:hypothetical protein